MNSSDSESTVYLLLRLFRHPSNGSCASLWNSKVRLICSIAQPMTSDTPMQRKPCSPSLHSSPQEMYQRFHSCAIFCALAMATERKRWSLLAFLWPMTCLVSKQIRLRQCPFESFFGPSSSSPTHTDRLFAPSHPFWRNTEYETSSSRPIYPSSVLRRHQYRSGRCSKLPYADPGSDL